MEYKFNRDWSNAPLKKLCTACDTENGLILTVKEDTQRRIFWSYLCSYKHCKIEIKIDGIY